MVSEKIGVSTLAHKCLQITQANQIILKNKQRKTKNTFPSCLRQLSWALGHQQTILDNL